MPLAIDEDVINMLKRRITMIKAAQASLAHVRCLRRSEGDWASRDCLGLTPTVNLSDILGGEADFLVELVAELPDPEQERIATSLGESAERVVDRYAAEVEELIGRL